MSTDSNQNNEASLSETVKNYRDERKFLHDIASPIGTALFLLDASAESLRAVAGIPEDEVTQIQQALDALLRVRDMMQARRKVLIDKEAAENAPKA